MRDVAYHFAGHNLLGPGFASRVASSPALHAQRRCVDQRPRRGQCRAFLCPRSGTAVAPLSWSKFSPNRTTRPRRLKSDDQLLRVPAAPCQRPAPAMPVRDSFRCLTISAIPSPCATHAAVIRHIRHRQARAGLLTARAVQTLTSARLPPRRVNWSGPGTTCARSSRAPRPTSGRLRPTNRPDPGCELYSLRPESL